VNETVTGGGGGGGSGRDPPVDELPASAPPHQEGVRTRRSAAIGKSSAEAGFHAGFSRHAARNLRPRNPQNTPANTKSTSDDQPKSQPDESILAIAAGLDVTATVRALARLRLPGKLRELGLKAHDTPAGRPKQLSVN